MAKSNKSSSGKGVGSYGNNSSTKGGSNRSTNANPKGRNTYDNSSDEYDHSNDRDDYNGESSNSKGENHNPENYSTDSYQPNFSKGGGYNNDHYDQNTSDYPSKNPRNYDDNYGNDAYDYGNSNTGAYDDGINDSPNDFSTSSSESKYNHSNSENEVSGGKQGSFNENSNNSFEHRSNNYEDTPYDNENRVPEYSSGKSTYSENEPINDPPPYDNFDEPIAKQANSNQDNNPEGKGGNGLPEADMVFTEEEVYGNSGSTEENRSDNRSDAGDIFERFVRRYGHLRFRNSLEINQFFSNHSNQPDFISWFAANIGGRGAWRHRRFSHVSSQNRMRFDLVWDNIPMLYTGVNQDHAINIFQFFGLVSIMINEVGQTFTPIRERGNLSYMFGTVIPASNSRPQRNKRSYNDFGRGPRNRNNKTAYELFNDSIFLSAHRDESLYDRVANTDNRAWDGHIYPNGFPTRPSEGGIIAQADFYKFSGRGLVQTTWSGAYMRLIDATLRYSGRNPVIVHFRNEWRRKQNDGLSIRDIASQTKNIDWDRLFMETNNEFACLAIYVFQNAKNNFLQIPSNAQRLRSTHSGSQGSGSIFYVGYRVGGSERYGNTVRDRVIQMMDKILQDHSQ